MNARGFSLVELMASIAIAGVLMAALYGIVESAAELKTTSAQEYRTLEDLQFAMERIMRHARYSERLLLPSVDRTESGQIENLRDEIVGAGGVTAVLALTLPTSVDRDGNGFADADNDRDGRIDEDTPGDMTNDSEPGIVGIDDDADQQIDEGFFADNNDDEYSLFSDEDPADGVDSDGDGTTDEDWGADNNADGAPGVAGMDDDGDGQTDEGSNADNDEDGQTGEDWLDPVVYFLSGGDLIERLPVPWDADGDTDVDGRDFIETPVLTGVTRFRVERVAMVEVAYPLVDVTLWVDKGNGEVRSLHTRMRVGGGL